MTKPLLDFTDLAFRRGKRLLMFQFQLSASALPISLWLA